MVTYNHEKYISRAIEGILIQETNFPIELIIGEDCSTDCTLEICLEYQERFPEIIKVIHREQNIGSQQNAISVFEHCHGKYIAACEGDDYWTDPLKLQKQIDILESNPKFAGCASQSAVIYENIDKESHLFKTGVNSILSINNFMESRPFHTASFVFRNNIHFRDLPLNIISNDRLLYLLVASFGDIYYLDEVTCVYRKNGASLSSQLNSHQLEKDLNMIPWLKKTISNFPVRKFRSFIHLTIYTEGISPSKTRITKLFRHYFLFVIFSFSYFPRNLGNVKWGTIWLIQIFCKKLFGYSN